MLHLYESFGWWRGVELRKIHNAEEYNELHHLLIMEVRMILISLPHKAFGIVAYNSVCFSYRR